MTQSKDCEEFGRRLLADFNNAFCQLKNISEVGTIFTEENQLETNMCPIHIEENCIGVEKWCIKYLYTFAYHQLCQHFNKKTTNDLATVNDLIRCVVIFCADCTSAWNLKKQIHNKISKQPFSQHHLFEDLKVTTLALKRHPKSTEAFAHRRFLLKQILTVVEKQHFVIGQNAFLQKVCSNCNKTVMLQSWLNSEEECGLTSNGLQLVEEEIKLCTQAAEWHICNYSAWSHRVWILTNVLLPCLFQRITGNETNDRYDTVAFKIIDMISAELKDTSWWIELHVSDHSCMAYAQFVFKCLTCICAVQSEALCSCSNIPSIWGRLKKYPTLNLSQLLSTNLRQNAELLLLHRGIHEALWSHRRGLLLQYHKFTRFVLSAILTDDNHIQNIDELYSLASEEQFCDNFVGDKYYTAIDSTAKTFAMKHLKFYKRFVIT